jgi:acetyl-CoA decarbonylase/synthase complex subunit epsilon
MMAAKLNRGQTAEIAGPKKANIFPNSNVVVAMVKRVKRPLLVIGSNAINTRTNDGDLVDSAIRMSSNRKLTVVATGHLVGIFRKRGVEKVHGMSIFVLGNHLCDPDWAGFDGKGNYDTVIFAGFPYYVEWLVESGIKNFGQLRTISLERSYQPNAEWSLGWMPEPDWLEVIEKIVLELEES